MSTSGITTFNQTADQVCTDALILLGVYGQGDTVTSNDLTFCRNILNKMVKSWEGQGIHMWTRVEGTLFFALNQQSYNLNASSADICGDYVIFNTLQANASGSSIQVASSIGMTVGDNIGIKLDNLSIQWTTITSIFSGTIGLNASLTSAASTGNNVFSFTNRTDKPLSISAARFRSTAGYERPLMLVSRTDFMNMPNKSNTGKANQIYYSPKVSDWTLYVWPVADDCGDCINISYLRRIQDFNVGTDNPDLPQEWLEPITYNLAIRIAPSYGIATAKLNPDITQIAQMSLQELQLFDEEDGGSVRINNNFRWDD